MHDGAYWPAAQRMRIDIRVIVSPVFASPDTVCSASPNPEAEEVDKAGIIHDTFRTSSTTCSRVMWSGDLGAGLYAIVRLLKWVWTRCITAQFNVKTGYIEETYDFHDRWALWDEFGLICLSDRKILWWNWNVEYKKCPNPKQLAFFLSLSLTVPVLSLRSGHFTSSLLVNLFVYYSHSQRANPTMDALFLPLANLVGASVDQIKVLPNSFFSVARNWRASSLSSACLLPIHLPVFLSIYHPHNRPYDTYSALALLFSSFSLFCTYTPPSSSYWEAFSPHILLLNMIAAAGCHGLSSCKFSPCSNTSSKLIFG